MKTRMMGLMMMLMHAEHEVGGVVRGDSTRAAARPSSSRRRTALGFAACRCDVRAGSGTCGSVTLWVG
eukprot:2124317-Rhodomonas_salina.1